MSAYVRRLKDATALEETRAITVRQETEAFARERLTPLEDRLARLLTSIPMEVQRDGLSLPVVQARLRGRWRGSCHPGELGAALRKLGFVRLRIWSGGECFNTKWFPSEDRR